MYGPRKKIHGTCARTQPIELLEAYSDVKKLKPHMAVINTDEYSPQGKVRL